MADRERNKSSNRSRSYSSDDNFERKSRRSSECYSRNKLQRSRKTSKKSRSRSRSLSSSSDSADRERMSRRKRTRSSSSSSSSSSEERKSRQKKRVKKLSKRRRRKSRSHSRSRSSSSSGSSSSSRSSSSDSEYERRKAKKSKHKTTKKKKKRKKTKKKSKKQMHAVNQNKYGKYGILTEADQYTKQPEFYCWLQEVKQVNPETLPRLETKKMFESYMEDYNTATFPHKKYYNLAPWEMKQDAKKRLKAMKKAQKNAISFADDETKHNRNFKGEEKRYGLSKERILEMKRAMKERAELEYKKNVGFNQSAKK